MNLTDEANLPPLLSERIEPGFFPDESTSETDLANGRESLSPELAPVPQTLEATGLGLHFLADLTCKHLYEAGVLSARELVCRLGLPNALVEQLLQFLRQEARVELRPLKGEQGLRFSLTEKGTLSARDALQRSGYTGVAPVPLEDYQRISAAQSVHEVGITREAIHTHFSGTVIDPALLDQLGTALNSGRAIFVYGLPGTGKTYITQRLMPLFDDTCLIPCSLAVGDSVVQLFDPVVHRALDEDREAPDRPSLLSRQSHDARFRLCRRPLVIGGGELTLDLFNVRHDAGSHQYQAPLQLKANNGMFIIDDMGRQQASPVEIFNRWIVPMEEQCDYLSLDSGLHFKVPFDLVLVFSSNVNPLELADEAFLRRIGYKIRFAPCTRDEYEALWRQECDRLDVPFEPDTFRYLVDELHRGRGIAMLPCLPRSLLNIAHNRSVFVEEALAMNEASLQWAWDNYFVRLEEDDND
ncbi:hypothetical protein [Marinimicrobium sp. C2-29]|uniref:hypothetical protein n=1 Tax=Marinimicrobium sp. C2-29 TaxID=3139825 RepID=UPI003138E0B3